MIDDAINYYENYRNPWEIALQKQINFFLISLFEVAIIRSMYVLNIGKYSNISICSKCDAWLHVYI